MVEFSVRFTRYKDGLRIISGPTVVHADDFNGAVTNANLILQGMRRADGNTDFEIASIHARLSGKTSDDKDDIWSVS